MGIKEDMMEKMMGTMSKEEKKKMMEDAMAKMMGEMTPEERHEMMDDMMKQFFGGTTEEEKGKMMGKMMPEMMRGMMRGGTMSAMSGMCAGDKEEGGMMKMMRRCMSEDFEPPWVTMESIMEEVLKTCGFALVHTPELHNLFREFLDKKQEEILSCIPEDYVTLEELQKKTVLSRESLVYLLLQLARKEEVDMQIKKK